MKNSSSVKLDKNKPRIFLLGTILALAVSVALILVFAFVLTVCDSSASVAIPAASVAIGIGGFFGALFCAKKIGEKGYLCGIVEAVVIFILNLIISISLNGVDFSAATPIRGIVLLIMSILGGIIGINGKSNRLVK